MKKKFKADIVCEACDGTGLYQGMAEQKGCAVICSNCDGTGKEEYELVYEEFKERKPMKGIKRVFKNSCGYKHGPDDFVGKDGTKIEFSKGGCTYEEFLKGEEPKPVKDLYCPKLWTFQNYTSERCDKGSQIGRRITECKYYETKEKCWKEYLEPLEKCKYVENLK